MKLKPNKKPKRRKSKTFLVLPLLDNTSDSATINDSMPKNPGLRLFTKTWPPKRDNNKKEDPTRPLTATLDKPTILDLSLIGKVDMSLVTKEFLNITNICRIPVNLAKGRNKNKNKKTLLPSRPLSLPATEKAVAKRTNKRCETGEDSWGEEESIKSAQSCLKMKPKKLDKKVINPISKLLNVKKQLDNLSDANNNNKTCKFARKRVLNAAELLNAPIESQSTKLSEPCKTCGRPDLPERFHSHPATPIKPSKKMEESPKIPVKSSVQKPVAIKYKSKQSVEKENKVPSGRKPSLPAQKLVHTPPNVDVQPKTPADEKPPSRVRSAKKTLTCYICGREFGTASLPLHEPKCLEKWKRENSSLPSHLQRKMPVKPDHPLTQDEWNKFAWESSQATLVPCSNCGRTFFPDRLAIHQRSCKGTLNNSNNKSEIPTSSSMSGSSPSTPTSSHQPPSVECYICGRPFGTHSIKIHERQCLNKWRIENDSLPPDMRAKEPVRKEKQKQYKPATPVSDEANAVENKDGVDRPPSGKRPPMFPCYLCGRLFSVNSIYIHEPQCLKKWQIENDKLPPHKRRQPPLKPDIKFTRDGNVDFGAMNEANWQSHLSQLVPCKICARTFNPERVAVHEKSCKG